MKIKKLDHVNIRTTRLDILIEWYQDVLGLRLGDRPDFPFPGAWMYAGDAAVVHLVSIDGSPAVGSETNLKMEHVAFTASGASSFEAKLKERQEHYQCVHVEALNTNAFNVWDPDGNHIHVDFPADE